MARALAPGEEESLARLGARVGIQAGDAGGDARSRLRTPLVKGRPPLTTQSAVQSDADKPRPSQRARAPEAEGSAPRTSQMARPSVADETRAGDVGRAPTSASATTKKKKNEDRAGAYEGQVVDGLRHGLGKLTFPNGDVYQGEFHMGMRQGMGAMTSAGDAASGGRKKRHYYEGQWRRSQKEGEGVEEWGSGERYEGSFVGNCFEGQGTYRTRSGTYKGQFAVGLKHGRGEMRFTSEDVYTGNWVRNRFEGLGTYVWASSDARYEGAWKNGLRDGFGVLFDPTGEKHEGQWKHGARHGPGTLRKRNGRCRDGIWRSGQFVTWTGSEYYGANVLKAATNVVNTDNNNNNNNKGVTKDETADSSSRSIQV